jgi:hypothetical protein
MGNTGRLIIIAFPIAASGPRGMKSILQGIRSDLRDFIDRPNLSLLIVFGDIAFICAKTGPFFFCS